MQCIAAKWRLLEGQQNEQLPLLVLREALVESGLFRAVQVHIGAGPPQWGPRKLTMETQARMRCVALAPTNEWSLRGLPDLTNLISSRVGGHTTELHSSRRGESRTCLKMLTSKGESKFDLLLLTFTWLTSPKFNKVKSMRNTYVTFKCAPNPGSEVKMPSHEIWSLCEPKIVWFLGTWYGLLTSEAVSGGEEHGPSCSGGKAPGACGGYREVTLWGKGGGQGSPGQQRTFVYRPAH